MPTKFEVTNLSVRPLGFPEVGKGKETVIGRGETKVLTVQDSVAALLEKMSRPGKAGQRAQVEISSLGTVALDHDTDGKKGGGRPATPKPAPGETPKPTPNADGGLDFDSLTDDQLRAYLAGNEVKFHPNTGREKLLAKAKEHEAEAAKEADEAAKKNGADAPEAV